jgi:hypothetical protein
MQMTITVNGQKFDSIEQMPPDVREQYERAMNPLTDREGNSIPDVIEGKVNATTLNPATTVVTKTTSRLVVNGREISADDVPANVNSLLRIAGAGQASSGSHVLFQHTLHFPLSWSSIFGIISVLSLIAFLVWIMSA